jgi:hypothetical protein
LLAYIASRAEDDRICSLVIMVPNFLEPSAHRRGVYEHGHGDYCALELTLLTTHQNCSSAILSV